MVENKGIFKMNNRITRANMPRSPLKTLAIVQARMGSTRLPGKVLRPLAGKPMLERVVSRVQRAHTLHQVVVATTTRPEDDAIQALCQKRGWDYYRGNAEDVLDRYYHAARTFQADIIVRITADCPLIEPEIIDRTVQAFFENLPEVDYASNVHPKRTFPRGLDVEVFSFSVLERIWKEDRNPAWREHVTPFIWKHPDRFRMVSVVNDEDLSYMRWTVDEVADLVFVQKIYDYFRHDEFTWRDVLVLLDRHPEWLEINRHVPQKEV